MVRPGSHRNFFAETMDNPQLLRQMRQRTSEQAAVHVGDTLTTDSRTHCESKYKRYKRTKKQLAKSIPNSARAKRLKQKTVRQYLHGKANCPDTFNPKWRKMMKDVD